MCKICESHRRRAADAVVLQIQVTELAKGGGFGQFFRALVGDLIPSKGQFSEPGEFWGAGQGENPGVGDLVLVETKGGQASDERASEESVNPRIRQLATRKVQRPEAGQACTAG